MEDCEKNETELDCGDKFDRCIKLFSPSNNFVKGCTTKFYCAKQSKACNQSRLCESDCCDSNGCNSSVQDGFNSPVPDGFNSTMPDRCNSTVPDGCNSSVPDRCSSSVIIAFLMVTFAVVSKMCY